MLQLPLPATRLPILGLTAPLPCAGRLQLANRPIMSIKLVDAETMTLRFPVGTRVECNCGQWKAGTITKHFYTQSSFTAGMCVPYQVKLDDGKLIFAPQDKDGVVRLLLNEPVDFHEEDEFMDEEVERLFTPLTPVLTPPI